MFARLKRFLGNLLGNVLYWVGWGLAVVVIAQAIILSVATGNPLLPVLLGLVGLAIWLIGMGIRSILAERQLTPYRGADAEPRLKNGT